ncbi:MAG: hypothetical protein RL112_269 [Planctomycetota bacterium]
MRVPWLASHASVAVGLFFACMGLGLAIEPWLGPAPAGAPIVWVADRDASLVRGLDGDLIDSRSHALGWPLAVVARADGGLWVGRSGNATNDFGARLLDLSARGAEQGELWLEALGDLDVLADGRALCLERMADGEGRLWRVDLQATPRFLLRAPGLRHVRAGGRFAWCGGEDGRLMQVDVEDGSVSAVACLPAPILGLRPTLDGGAWVALGGAAPILARLDSRLARMAQADLEAPVAFDVLPESAGAWTLERSGAVLRARTRDGRPRLEVDLAILPEARHVLALPDGGALVASPGGIVRFDAQGAQLPGQGGFAWINGWCRASPP